VCNANMHWQSKHQLHCRAVGNLQCLHPPSPAVPLHRMLIVPDECYLYQMVLLQLFRNSVKDACNMMAMVQKTCKVRVCNRHVYIDKKA
jgi:CBS-domain-containing membrane protein